MKSNTNTIFAPKEYDIICGIDTGKTTGFSVWNRHIQQLTAVESMLIHQAMNRILLLRDKFRLGVVVEDARLATFGRDTQCDFMKAQGAGSVKRDAVIWEDFLTDSGIPFRMVRPAMRKQKIDATLFRKMTGWEKITNSHGRDSGCMVFKYC